MSTLGRADGAVALGAVIVDAEDRSCPPNAPIEVTTTANATAAQFGAVMKKRSLGRRWRSQRDPLRPIHMDTSATAASPRIESPCQTLMLTPSWLASESRSSRLIA